MPTNTTLRSILETSQTIAMVGASSNPSKPSYEIMKGLLAAGFTVIPVNPTETEVLGQRAYASLEEIPEPVDIVNVFRRPEQTPEIADEAVKIGARVLWLQTGIVSEEAANRARGGRSRGRDGRVHRRTTARLRIRSRSAAPAAGAKSEHIGHM